MKYELIYTKDSSTAEQVIGAQINKKFIPKTDGESEQAFLKRLEQLKTAAQNDD